MYAYCNDASDTLKDSYKCHYTLSPLSSIIVYGHRVRSIAMALRCCVLLRVSKLVRVARYDFFFGLPTQPK